MRTLVFDTETTDLIANSLISERHQPHIIEFYGCIIDDEGEILEELDFLCDPGVPVTEDTTRITGIKPSDIAGKPKFDAFAESVKKLIESADRVVAHNLKFDMSVVDVEMARINMSVAWPDFRTCTVEDTEWFFSYRLSLSALHNHLFGSAFDGAHRAKVDVHALVRCFNELRDRGEI